MPLFSSNQAMSQPGTFVLAMPSVWYTLPLQHEATELPAMVEMVSICFVASGHMWLLSTRNVASVFEKLNF